MKSSQQIKVKLIELYLGCSVGLMARNSEELDCFEFLANCTESQIMLIYPRNGFFGGRSNSNFFFGTCNDAIGFLFVNGKSKRFVDTLILIFTFQWNSLCCVVLLLSNPNYDK